jgi:hypothetical protein
MASPEGEDLSMKILQLQCIIDAKDREMQILREKASQDPEVKATVVLCELSNPVIANVPCLTPKVIRRSFWSSYGRRTRRCRSSCSSPRLLAQYPAKQRRRETKTAARRQRGAARAATRTGCCS